MLRIMSRKKITLRGMIICALCFFVLAVNFAATASAADYYVATWGSDSNPGTLAAPWQHPSYSAQLAAAGDTIYLIGGTWYGDHVVFYNSGTPGNPIVMKAYNGTPTLNGQNSGRGIVVSNRQYIKIEGLKIYDYGDTGDDHSIYGSSASHITITNNDISYSAYLIMFEDSDNITINNNKVHNAQYKNSIHFTSNANKVSSDILIENNSVYNNDGKSTNGNGDALDLFVAGDNAKIQRYTVRNNSFWNGPEAMFNHGIGNWAGIYNVTITNNYFRNFSSGLKVSYFAGDPATNIIANNVVDDINGNYGFGGNGIESDNPVPTQVTVKNNIITNSANCGMKDASPGNMNAMYNLINGAPGGYYCSYGGYAVNVSGVNINGADPLFADSANRDFHLKSQYGRWDPSTQSWVTDSVTSPAIDAGDPADDFSKEPSPNGGRINIGAYGNTPEASKSAGLDTTPPTVIFTDPANNAINVPATKTITVTFSENIQQGASYNNISLKDSNNNIISITKSIAGSVLTIEPVANLEYSTTYTISIPAIAVKDLSNNDLANPYSFSFTTSAQPVLTTIDVSPFSITLINGSTQQFTAQPKDQFGNPYPATVTWTSSNTTVGTITQAGLFTALTAGVTTITASNGSISGTAQANVTQQAQGGLIAYWRFDEGGGTSALDSSGNYNHGTVYGATWTTGKVNSALQFDGASNYVEVLKSNSIDNITSQITIEAWVKTPLTSRGTIVERWLYDPTAQRAYVGTVQTDGSIQFLLSSDGTNTPTTAATLTSSGRISPDTWTHVALTSDGATMKIYINGNQDPATAVPPAGGIYVSAANLHIGAWEWGSTSRSTYFNGAIDEVKIYSRALNADDIRADYFKEGGTNLNSFLSGTVEDLAGNPILGARINANGYTATTNSSGGYNLTLPAGNYTPVAAKNGYESRFQQAALIENQTTIANFQLPSGPSSTNVILWDTNKRYTQKDPSQTALAEKSNWTHVPYGLTNYTWIGDAMIENENYYLFLFSNNDDSPALIAKLEGGATWSNEIYKVYDAGDRIFGMGNMWTKILNNTLDEVTVESAERGQGLNIPIVTAYNISKKPWLEVMPVQNVNQQGHHDKRRLAALVFNDFNKDILLDAKKHGSFEENIYPQKGTLGILGFHRQTNTESDFMWFTTYPSGAEENSLTYVDINTDPYWEWDCKPCAPSVGAQYAYLGQKVVIGVLNNKDNWKREDVNQYLNTGQIYKSTFKAPYSGKWRVAGVYSDDYWNITDHFSEVEVNAGNQFAFTSPRNGTLEYLVMYLFNRTVNTPANVTTPIDVYREAIASIPDRPPSSVSNLKNNTYMLTYINWSWTDPADADFSKVMVYLNGTFQANVTKGVQFFNATALPPDTAYTISTHTVDASGNVNQTWVNHTARTAPTPTPSNTDVNLDGHIDIADLVIVGQHFSETTASPYPRYDVNADGKVDILDITLVASKI